MLHAKLWVKTKLQWRSDALNEENDCIEVCANAPADTCFIVLVLRGTDGLASHCVAVVKHWIFDSNLSKFLPLTTLPVHAFAVYYFAVGYPASCACNPSTNSFDPKLFRYRAGSHSLGYGILHGWYNHSV